LWERVPSEVSGDNGDALFHEGRGRSDRYRVRCKRRRIEAFLEKRKPVYIRR
jgi:hypothetical protein